MARKPYIKKNLTQCQKNNLAKLRNMYKPQAKYYVVIQFRKPCRRVSKIWALNGKAIIFPSREAALLAIKLWPWHRMKLPNDWVISSWSVESTKGFHRAGQLYRFPHNEPNELD